MMNIKLKLQNFQKAKPFSNPNPSVGGVGVVQSEQKEMYANKANKNLIKWISDPRSKMTRQGESKPSYSRRSLGYPSQNKRKANANTKNH